MSQTVLSSYGTSVFDSPTWYQIRGVLLALQRLYIPPRTEKALVGDLFLPLRAQLFALPAIT